MAGDALKGIYEALTPTSIPFPTVDPQYADLYEMWKNRVRPTPVPPRARVSAAFGRTAALFRSLPFALVLIALGLLLYLLLRRSQARAEELNARTSERVQGRLVKTERAGGRNSSKRATVEYVWWGKAYTAEIVLPPFDRREPGSPVSLMIDPGDPECFRPDAPPPKLLVPKILSFALIAAGLALLAAATL